MSHTFSTPDDHLDADPEIPDDEQPTEYALEHASMRVPLNMPTDQSFFTPGRDTGGASERLFVRISPRHRDWLASVTNDKRFPFKGMNHLVRWCIDQGLRKIDRIRPTPTLSTQVAALQRILYEEQVAADFALLMQQTELRVAAYLREGAKGEAARMVQAMKVEVESMPDGYWKGRYGREIQTRWGDLLTADGIGFETDLGMDEQAEESRDAISRDDDRDDPGGRGADDEGDDLGAD